MNLKKIPLGKLWFGVIKEQTPQERYNFKVTVNGEEIDPKSMSESSWMNLRG